MDITDKEYELIKNYIKRFSNSEIIEWRNKMVKCGEVNNRLFSLLNKEMMERACEINKKERSK